MLIRPILGECPHCRELNTLSLIVDRFLLGPSGRLNAALEVCKVRVRKTHFERTNIGVLARCLLCRLSRCTCHSIYSPVRSLNLEPARNKAGPRNTEKAAARQTAYKWPIVALLRTY